MNQSAETQDQEQQHFFALAERFRDATEPDEIERLGDELGRLIFGE
ncbi:MAG TPA: hypothetical protein VGR50_04115 [Terriglobales bacterium]|nr:hypothetical protein [Terriglobales bacterium]